MSIDESTQLTELTELTTTLSKRLESHEPFRELRRRLGEARFPIDLEGVQGGFLAYLASRLHEEITDGPIIMTSS